MGRHAGSHSKKPTVGNARYRIWQSMRVFKKSGHAWTIRDLVTIAEASVHNVRLFVKALLRYRYVTIVQPKQPGKVDGDARHKLIRDTGPYPPRARLNGTLYDQNTNTVLEGPGDE